MLLKQHVLKEIVAGRVSLVFRKWKRPTVKAGGQLRTPIGVLAIEAVDEVKARQITPRDAECAGYSSRGELLTELNSRSLGSLYRIRLHYAGRDQRIELRKRDKMSPGEMDELGEKLSRMDTRTRDGPWTVATLRLIEQHPGQRATELAEAAGMETKRFKSSVRKLKELGLTESLQIGYRLSPRGTALLKHIGG